VYVHVFVLAVDSVEVFRMFLPAFLSLQFRGRSALEHATYRVQVVGMRISNTVMSKSALCDQEATGKPFVLL
jgi:hypothetical protein